MKVIVYTFRTFHSVQFLNDHFNNAFVLGKLKDDMRTLAQEIIGSRPDLIVGFANPIGKMSQIESVAVNRFNTKGAVTKGGKDTYPLFAPGNLGVPFSQITTTSFCNWSVYKIAELLDSHRLPSKLAFFHLFDTDLKKICDAIRARPDFSSTRNLIQ